MLGIEKVKYGGNHARMVGREDLPGKTKIVPLLMLTLVVLAVVGTEMSAEGAQCANTLRSYTIIYPHTWTAHGVKHGNQVILTSYPWKQQPQGLLVKPGGACILLNPFPPYNMPLFPEGADDATALADRAKGDDVISRQLPGNGHLARITSDRRDYRTSETIRHIGGLTFLGTLEYETGNPRGAAYERVLDKIVMSINITGAKQSGRGLKRHPVP